MTRGMGSISVWTSAALVLASGCGGSTANQNRGRIYNPNAVAMSAPRGEIVLRYAPAPGLAVQRTTRLSATMEGRRLEMETVMRVTLAPEPASQCVHASISLDGQVIELPCEPTSGAPTQMLNMVHRLDALVSLAIIEYPDRPVRIGDSWPCPASEGDQCRWTLTGIEDSPAGLVALLHADGMGSAEGRPMQGQMTFTARVSDGVMLRGEVDAIMGGQLSFHISISATDARPTN